MRGGTEDGVRPDRRSRTGGPSWLEPLSRAALILTAGPLLLAGCEAAPGESAGTDDPSDGVPRYAVDASWPGDLPNDWILGQVSGIAVDGQDHVWVLHRPRTLTEREAGAVQDPPLAECCVPAPAVLELDAEGKVLRSWGGPDHHPDWPPSEHGIYVDGADNVWIGSNSRGSTVVLQFTADGEHVRTLGVPGDPGAGSNDTTRLSQPTDVFVDDEAGEVYVADGYGNRRIIVFDRATGAYRRHWGAYGERPHDDPLPPYDPDAPPSRSFHAGCEGRVSCIAALHAVAVSEDDLVYAADRSNNRIQVFREDGTFVREGWIAPETLAMGSVWDIGFSADPDQSFLLVPDGTNMKAWIVRRSDLEVVGSFGRGGRQAGQFNWVHNLAVNSEGAVYTSEVSDGKRVQRFVPVSGAEDP